MSNELDKIKRDWELFCNVGNFRKTLPDYALFHMRRAFFAGAAAMLSEVAKLSEPESVARGEGALRLDVAMMQGEIEDFCKDIIKGRA